MFKLLFCSLSLFLNFIIFFQSTVYASSIGRVGLAATDATPELGVPLGGYGSPKRKLSFPWDIFGKFPFAVLQKPSVGVLSPIRSKAMFVQSDLKKLLFVSVDTVGVEAGFDDAMVERLGALGFKEDEIFISATHTHSGPGTLSKNLFWELTVMDFFQEEVYDRFFESVYETARLAVEKSEPAKVYSVSFQAQNLQHNRRGKVGQFDPQAHALLAQNLSGQWLGGMINLPIHGTALGPENLFYSSDVPGAMEKETELLLKSEVNNPVILFMNGAEGDVAPIRGGVEGIAQIGQSFSQQLQAAMPSMRELSFDWDVQYTRFKLGKAALSIKTCTQGSLKDWIPSWLNLNVSALFPRRVPIAMIRWDGLAMMTWPGEPTTSLGFAAKNIAKEAGANEVWNLGLTNGYLAYFTSPEEHRENTYEACSSLYKNGGGSKILDEMRKLAGLR